jgi:hypothetical protein
MSSDFIIEPTAPVDGEPTFTVTGTVLVDGETCHVSIDITPAQDCDGDDFGAIRQAAERYFSQF